MFVIDVCEWSQNLIGNRICLKFCVSNGITVTELLKIMQKCFADSTLSSTIVLGRHNAFSEGREIIENLPHRPNTPVKDEKIEKVKETLLKNCRVGIREIAENLLWIDSTHFG